MRVASFLRSRRDRHGAYADPFADAVAGIEDNFIARLEAVENLRLGAAAWPGLDASKFGPAIVHDERGPFRTAPEKAAGGSLERAGRFPDHDARLDSKPVSETGSLLRGRDEVGDDVDALLLDPEGGDFGERGGFDEADARFEGCLAAPMVEFHDGTGPEGGGVPGQNLDHDLQIGGIAEVDEGRAWSDDPRAFLVNAQNPAGNGGPEFYRRTGGGVWGGCGQRRRVPVRGAAEFGEFSLGLAQGTFGGGGFLGGGGFAPLDTFEFLGGDGEVGEELLEPLEFECGEAKGLPGFGELGVGGVPTGFGEGARAGVEEGRGEGIEDSEDSFASEDGGAGLERDSAELTCHGSEDGVALTDSGAAFLVDRDAEGAFGDAADLDGKGLGAEPGNEDRDEKGGARPREPAAARG